MPLMEYPPWIPTASDIQSGIDTGLQVGLGKARNKQAANDELVHTMQSAAQMLQNSTDSLQKWQLTKAMQKQQQDYHTGLVQARNDALKLARDKLNYQQEQSDLDRKDASLFMDELNKGGGRLSPSPANDPGGELGTTPNTTDPGGELSPSPATTPAKEPSVADLISKYPRALKAPHIQTILAAKAQEGISADVDGFMKGYAQGKEPADLLAQFPKASRDSGVHSIISQHEINKRFATRQTDIGERGDKRYQNALTQWRLSDLSKQIAAQHRALSIIDRTDLTDDEKAAQKDAIQSEIDSLKSEQEGLLKGAAMQTLPITPGTDPGAAATLPITPNTDKGTADPLGLFTK